MRETYFTWVIGNFLIYGYGGAFSTVGSFRNFIIWLDFLDNKNALKANKTRFQIKILGLIV